MFDTMTLTKAGGAFCGALLIYLLGVWAAETIYHPAAGHGDHGEEHAKAFVIETAPAAAEAAPADGQAEFQMALAEGDAAKGEKAFGKCKACHKLEEGGKASGPHLFGVVGRQIGSVEGYSYSKALAGLDRAWTPEALNDWLADPRKYLSGTKMNVKTPKVSDRANLVVYLAAVAGQELTVAPVANEAPAEDTAAATTEEAAPAAATTTDAGSEFMTLYAEADVAKGERAFSKCKACHKLEVGGKASGPHLVGVVGRQIGSVEGFKYSKALTGLTDVWTPEALNEWLTDPRKYLKGTKMSAKTPKIADRANLVAYLASIGG